MRSKISMDVGQAQGNIMQRGQIRTAREGGPKHPISWNVIAVCPTKFPYLFNKKLALTADHGKNILYLPTMNVDLATFTTDRR